MLHKLLIRHAKCLRVHFGRSNSLPLSLLLSTTHWGLKSPARIERLFAKDPLVHESHQLTVIWMRKRTRHMDRRHLNWLLPSGRNNFSAAGNPTAVAAYSAFFLPPVLELTDAARLLLSPLPASCISMFSCTRFPYCRLSLLSVPLSPSTPYTVIDWWDCGILPSP